jgi:hypothetical protein
MITDRDASVRLRAFEFLAEQRRRSGDGRAASRRPEPRGGAAREDRWTPRQRS